MAKEEMDAAYVQQFVKSIPPKFTQHLVNRNHQKATIVSPLGKFWHVDLQREGHEMFFGGGWEDFVKAHGLSVGHFLVFRYQGNMVFTIKIFDKSGCLKEYDSTASTYASIEVVDVDDEILDDAPKDIDGTSLKSSGRKGSKSRKRVSRFEWILRHYNITSMRIAIPKVVCSSNGLTTQCAITLEDQKRRLWPAVFLPRSRGGGYIGKGWRCFSKANNLKEGDRCIFKFASEKVMRVRIVRR